MSSEYVREPAQKKYTDKKIMVRAGLEPETLSMTPT